jgi:thiamine pyrophosphokinase
VIAADSGADRAAEAGVRVDLVVGDLDSISPPRLDALTAGGVSVERHPTDKDETDLELALRLARDRHPDRIVVLGGDGGRLDHVLGNVVVLAQPAAAGLAVEAWFGHAHVHIVDAAHPLALAGEVGSYVSLLALHGPVRGVTTSGLRWRLDGDDLEPGIARGVSNELVEPQATVAVAAGTLVVVQP